jgi:hypothetical protein
MLAFGFEPVQFKTIAQMQTGAVKHDPKVVCFDTQNLADFFGSKTVHLAQSESTRRPLRQGREAIAKNFPEITALQQLRRRRMPLIGRAICVPMTLPSVRSFKKLAVFRTFVTFLADRSLTPKASKMIYDLMFQDSDQPGSLRTSPFKMLVCL